METENAPTPGGVTDRTVVIRNETEEYPLTVDHNGLYAGAAFVAVAGDQTAPANTARSVPVPTATRDGNTVTIEWVDPTTDTAGTVRSVSIYRGYEGTGDGEATLRGTVAVGTTTFTDSIADVPSGYYIFYTLGLVFSDGHTTPHSAIAADGTGAIVK